MDRPRHVLSPCVPRGLSDGAQPRDDRELDRVERADGGRPTLTLVVALAAAVLIKLCELCLELRLVLTPVARGRRHDTLPVARGRRRRRCGEIAHRDAADGGGREGREHSSGCDAGEDGGRRLHVVRDEALVGEALVVPPLDQIEQRGGLRGHVAQWSAREADDDGILGGAQQLAQALEHEHPPLVAQDLHRRPDEIMHLWKSSRGAGRNESASNVARGGKQCANATAQTMSASRSGTSRVGKPRRQAVLARRNGQARRAEEGAWLCSPHP